MKKFHVIAAILVAFFISFVIVSCNKNKEEFVRPQQDVNSEDVSSMDAPRSIDGVFTEGNPDDVNSNSNLKEADVPDESTSSTVTWDKLPADLKNAPELKNDPSVQSAASLESMEAAACRRYATPAFGGTGGSAFAIIPSCNLKIHAIAIRNGAYVNSIAIWYRYPNGRIAGYVRRGSLTGSYHYHRFASGEVITSAGGRYGSYLDRITVRTTRRYFSYGGNGGRAFMVYASPGYHILGFHGRSGNLIDKLGFYVYRR